MLTAAAFNALLKTLEEPPAHVKFIFATTEVHKLPTTILSRCQRFDLHRIPEPLIRAHLAHICELEKVAAEPPRARRHRALRGGRPARCGVSAGPGDQLLRRPRVGGRRALALRPDRLRARGGAGPRAGPGRRRRRAEVGARAVRRGQGPRQAFAGPARLLPQSRHLPGFARRAGRGDLHAGARRARRAGAADHARRGARDPRGTESSRKPAALRAGQGRGLRGRADPDEPAAREDFAGTHPRVARRRADHAGHVGSARQGRAGAERSARGACPGPSPRSRSPSWSRPAPPPPAVAVSVPAAALSKPATAGITTAAAEAAWKFAVEKFVEARPLEADTIRAVTLRHQQGRAD